MKSKDDKSEDGSDQERKYNNIYVRIRIPKLRIPLVKQQLFRFYLNLLSLRLRFDFIILCIYL